MDHSMIRFYVQSQVSGKDLMDSSAQEMRDKLERVFDTLEKYYGVTMLDRRIEGLDTEVLQNWFNDTLTAKHWKPATVNSYVNTLNPFLRWAAGMSSKGVPYIDVDCSRLLRTKKLPDPDKLPEDQRPQDKYFSVEQVEELLHGDHGRNQVRDSAIIAMFLWSGLRVSELCQITVGNYLDGRAENCVSVARKGSAYKKKVEIGDSAYPYVDAYLKTRADIQKEQPLFMTTHGAPCSRKQIYKSLSFKQKEIGIATGPHALRHTNLSSVDKVSSASVVRDIANHKNFRVTNRYTHSSHEERLAALNALPWK